MIDVFALRPFPLMDFFLEPSSNLFRRPTAVQFIKDVGCEDRIVLEEILFVAVALACF
jgi:hypothetical protein